MIRALFASAVLTGAVAAQAAAVARGPWQRKAIAVGVVWEAARFDADRRPGARDRRLAGPGPRAVRTRARIHAAVRG
jgi:hypothetical protein